MVLLILAVIWAAVLIPPALKARAEHSPADSIGAFRRQLSVLERTAPANQPGAYRIAPYAFSGSAPVAQQAARPARTLTRQQARQRRRQLFVGLLGAVPTTFLVAMVGGSGILWLVHLLTLGAFAGFVTLLIRARNLAAEQEMKVRFLPGTSPMATMSMATPPELALRRSAQ